MPPFGLFFRGDNYPAIGGSYQTQKLRLAVSDSLSLQCVVITLVFLATLIFVNVIGLTYFDFLTICYQFVYQNNELSLTLFERFIAR